VAQAGSSRCADISRKGFEIEGGSLCLDVNGISLIEREPSKVAQVERVGAYVFWGLSSPDIGMSEISHNNTCSPPFWFCLKILSRAYRHIVDFLADLVCLEEVRELAGYVLPNLVIGV
jgi:hypothetical protein